ncbi:MAG: TolC family protein, partial [Cyclobacteriaceae bacterium]|nr:TolC family protein [Cyclobacteriaceae bacterium]
MKTRHSIFRRINLFSLWLFRKKGLGLLSFLLLNISLQAQTLDEYLIIAAENNPGLKAAYARYEASLERINQPGLPDPELRAGFFFRPMERFMGNQQADIQLMQMFPWFGTIGTQKEEANWMAQAQYQLFLEEKNRLLFEVKSTWFELIRLQEEIRIEKENLEFLEKYERLALIKFQAAGGNPNSMSNPSEMIASSSNNSMRDVLQIQISKRELENSIEQIEANREPLQIKFNQLLNRDIRAAIQLPSEFSPIQLEVGKLEVLDSIRNNHPLLAR